MMKTSKFIIATCWIALAAVVWSCNDSGDEAPAASQENLITNNVLIGSNAAVSRLRGQGLAGPVGAVYGNFYSTPGGRTSGTPSSTMRNARGSNDPDSTDIEPQPSCVVETWEDDGQGNYTYILDFGDGCNYYGEFMKGKLVEKGSYSENSFTAKVIYTGFGGEDWQIDGLYKYDGTWEEIAEPIDGASVPADTIPEDSTWLFSATYNFEADLTEQWTDYGYPDTVEVSTGEIIITVDYVANGSEKMDNDGYTVETQNESITVSTCEAYTSQVDVPLHYNFSCKAQNVWIFVSGIESGSYTYGDTSGTYTIDFGDGTCDNIITVTENGITEDVNLEDEWEEWEEECEDDHEDDGENKNSDD